MHKDNMPHQNTRLISVSITIIALVMIIARIRDPEMNVDNVTLWLLLIAIAPWFAPLIKSIDLGGAKLEFWQSLKELQAEMATMHSEMENMAQTLRAYP